VPVELCKLARVEWERGDTSVLDPSPTSWYNLPVTRVSVISVGKAAVNTYTYMSGSSACS
jgi:hypothetical protein